MSLILNAISISPKGAPPLFAPLSLTLGLGEIGTIMGPSGVGKSSLLDAIAGHLPAVFTCHGEVTLNSRSLNNVPPESRRIGLMFQDAVLFPHLSVGDNLAFGLRAQIKNRDMRRDMVQQALTQAGLPGMADRDPATLSGGQRARVALMRTLLAGPKALLLDEPFSKLDAGLRAEMRAFTFDHIRARKIPALMVTHDSHDADGTQGPVLHLS
jgi:putative thiamine transport system ATP-binding protein